MKSFSTSKLLLAALLLAGCKSSNLPKELKSMSHQEQDPYLWLEEVEGAKALDFAKSENEVTLKHFKSNPLFKGIEADYREIYFAKDRVPGVSLHKGILYNFWQDEKNARGLWRTTTIESYKSDNPKWDVILDLDALAKAENENWVWKGASFRKPHYDRVLLHLSRGGKDAVVVREFDLKTKSFIKDGFILPEAKTNASWKDENTLFVGTDWGPGSMTDSGYARIVKTWKRGTPLSAAEIIAEANTTDMSTYAYASYDGDKPYYFHQIRKGFYSSKLWYDEKPGKSHLVAKPEDAESWGVFKGHLIISLRTDFKSFKAGSLVAMPIGSIEKGENALSELQLIFAPTEKRFIQGGCNTKNHMIMVVSDNVLTRMEKVTFTPPNTWKIEPISLGHNGMASCFDSEDESDTYLATYTDFLTPTSFYIASAADPKNEFKLLKQAPKRFDSSSLTTSRFEATSKDGTKIPYFVVHKKDIRLDGSNPTLQYGYGGFQASMTPSYLSALGKVWAEKGGVYVLTNLRGGGEFGPKWHQSVLKENRYKVYEDNIAISEDLIARGFTSPQHLAISGGSNGGLLVGATITMRPDLYKAAIIGVPLLDMLRYHKLLAGASWMDEYGNPDDPKMREAILKYSPYQKLSPTAKYPEVFVMTSTKDDRVHPGHARKFVARMKEQKHPVYYYENTEGGHAGNANLEQSILWESLKTTYLWEKLK
ncbi:prolyl oligopeptidase family serine peptidase [Bdellovibrio sp. HCB209]|uniref:prolyl oligopeptidase family serine peptidase n=1 Tax=Bdellovibrio sp. HCB209 TaxID=3394354 RepID=UPI0039B41162